MAAQWKTTSDGTSQAATVICHVSRAARVHKPLDSQSSFKIDETCISQYESDGSHNALRGCKFGRATICEMKFLPPCLCTEFYMQKATWPWDLFVVKMQLTLLIAMNGKHVTWAHLAVDQALGMHHACFCFIRFARIPEQLTTTFYLITCLSLFKLQCSTTTN
jgi:hypothetical protein